MTVQSRSAIVVLSKFYVGCIFVLSRSFMDFSVGVGAFVIELSQIFSFFHKETEDHLPTKVERSYKCGTKTYLVI